MNRPVGPTFGVSYFGVRDPRHARRDLDEIAEAGFAAVTHTFSEHDLRYHVEDVGRLVEETRARGLEAALDPWGVAGLFGGLPNTSFSQNVGLIAMTGVMSRHVVTIGAIFLIVCGFVPKIGAAITTIPIEVLGGGVIVMFGMVAAAGVNMLSAVNWNRRNMVIFAVALAIVILLSPLLLLIVLAIRINSPGPIIHRRRVLGVSGRQFDAFKFRTMYVNGAEILERRPALKAALEADHKLKDDPRITRVGKWLRRYSLDEIPQLFNVIRGEMGLVGPRMISPEEAYAKSNEKGRFRPLLRTPPADFTEA